MRTHAPTPPRSVPHSPHIHGIHWKLWRGVLLTCFRVLFLLPYRFYGKWTPSTACLFSQVEVFLRSVRGVGLCVGEGGARGVGGSIQSATTTGHGGPSLSFSFPPFSPHCYISRNPYPSSFASSLSTALQNGFLQTLHSARTSEQ